MDAKLSRVCPVCKKVKTYASIYGLRRAILENKSCHSCILKERNKTRIYCTKEKNSQWKGYNEIPFNWFSRYFLRKRHGRKVQLGDITIQDVYALWVSQDKKCALSGVPIGFYDDDASHTCSIDRIDSTKGYILANIQLVHKHVNIMKNKFDQTYFIEFCRLITETSHEHNNQN